jgi:hypothetical protein
MSVVRALSLDFSGVSAKRVGRPTVRREIVCSAQLFRIKISCVLSKLPERVRGRKTMKPFYQPKVIAFGLFAALLGSLSSSAARAGTIFETNIGDSTVGAYTTAGATLNAALISGLKVPTGIAVSGVDLFVANATTGTIGEYTTSGTLVNAALITGLDNPSGIALSGSDLFVANANGSGTIGEYTTPERQ